MIAIDIAAATFLLMCVGGVFKLMNEMKVELKQSLKVEADILAELQLLSYRVLQLENKM